MSIQTVISSKHRNASFIQYLKQFTFQPIKYDAEVQDLEGKALVSMIVTTCQLVQQNPQQFLPLLQERRAYMIIQFTDVDSVQIGTLSLYFSKYTSIIPTQSPEQTATMIAAFGRYALQTDAIFSKSYQSSFSEQASDCLKTLVRENVFRQFQGKTLREICSMSLDELSKVRGMGVASAKAFINLVEGQEGAKRAPK